MFHCVSFIDAWNASLWHPDISSDKLTLDAAKRESWEMVSRLWKQITTDYLFSNTAKGCSRGTTSLPGISRTCWDLVREDIGWGQWVCFRFGFQCSIWITFISYTLSLGSVRTALHRTDDRYIYVGMYVDRKKEREEMGWWKVCGRCDIRIIFYGV